MLTVLVTDSHELVITQRERIMQRSKLVDKMHFLVPPTYDGLDMSLTTVCMEYLDPRGGYHNEILTKSPELYKDHLEYLVPFDTKLTRDWGDIEIQLTFTSVNMDDTGKVTQYVRKTRPVTIKIIEIAEWSMQIPDSDLTALDQRLIKQDMQMAQMLDITMAVADSVPDDIVEKDGKIYLSQNGQVMPNTVGANVLVPRTYDDDALPGDGVIELGEIIHNENDPDCDCGCDHNNFEELDSYVATPPEDPEFGNFTEL